MEHVFSVDWRTLFTPEHSVFEMVVRGTLIYLALFIIMRLFGRRQSGSLSTADLLVVVLIADAAQNGLAHEYKSVTEGVALVVTIVAWDMAIDWASFRFPALRPVLSPPALPLIKNGVLQRRNMRKEMVTEDELLSLLRQEGVESPSAVKLAQLEVDGKISVLKRKG